MALPDFEFTSRARPWLEVGLGDSRVPTGQARWDVSRWDQDTARWAGTDPTWLDVSSEVFTARCEYGRARSNDRFVPGVATIELDNESGWADPEASDDIAVFTMRPGRAVRFGVDHVTLGRLVLWRGFIDSITPRYLPDGQAEQTAVLSCVDALGEVNRAKFAGNTATIGAGEQAHNRINWILESAQWPADKRALSPSSTTLVGYELNGQAADLMGRAADSAGGVVFGDRDGRIVYRGRDWQTWAPTVPVSATIGNVGAADVVPSEWVRPFARRDIATRAIMGRDVETAYVADDTAGQIVYGIEPFERTDLWTANDSELEILAERTLRVRSWSTAPVVRGVVLDAATSDAALDVQATADPYAPTHYRCRLAYPNRTVFDDRYLTTGIVHELSSSSWITTINLDLAAPFEALGSLWDIGRWDRAYWAEAV